MKANCFHGTPWFRDCPWCAAETEPEWVNPWCYPMWRLMSPADTASYIRAAVREIMTRPTGFIRDITRTP